MVFANVANYRKPDRMEKLGDLATIEFLQGWSSSGVRRRAADDPRLGNHGDVHDSKRLLLSRLGSWKECRFCATSNEYSSVLVGSALTLELLHTFLLSENQVAWPSGFRDWHKKTMRRCKPCVPTYSTTSWGWMIWKCVKVLRGNDLASKALETFSQRHCNLLQILRRTLASIVSTCFNQVQPCWQTKHHRHSHWLSSHIQPAWA